MPPRQWKTIAPRPSRPLAHPLVYVNQRAVHRYLWMVHRRMVTNKMGREARDALFFDLKMKRQLVRRVKKKRRTKCDTRRRFPCALCDYSATYKGNLTRHVKKYH